MAKTVFANGTVVTHTFLNTIFGANAAGGHKHDGGANDGSCPKVSLSTGAEVTGTLPFNMVEAHTHNGTSSAKINPVDHVDGVSEGAVGLTFADTQFSAQQTASIWWRKETTPTASEPAFVTLHFSKLYADSNGTHLYPAETLAAGLRPKNDVFVRVPVYDNDQISAGILKIQTTGAMVFGVEVRDVANEKIYFGFANFVGSSKKGFSEFSVTYPIWP